MQSPVVGVRRELVCSGVVTRFQVAGDVLSVWGHRKTLPRVRTMRYRNGVYMIHTQFVLHSHLQHSSPLLKVRRQDNFRSVPKRQAMWLVSVCGGRPDYSVAAVWPSRGFGYCYWCRARHPRAGGSSGEGRLHIGCIAYTGGSLRDALFFKVGSPWHEVIASDPSSGLAASCRQFAQKGDFGPCPVRAVAGMYGPVWHCRRAPGAQSTPSQEVDVQ